MTDQAPVPQSFAARIKELAAEKPDAPAVSCENDSLTWGALHQIGRAHV